MARDLSAFHILSHTGNRVASTQPAIQFSLSFSQPYGISPSSKLHINHHHITILLLHITHIHIYTYLSIHTNHNANIPHHPNLLQGLVEVGVQTQRLQGRQLRELQGLVEAVAETKPSQGAGEGHEIQAFIERSWGGGRCLGNVWEKCVVDSTNLRFCWKIWWILGLLLLRFRSI